MGKEFDRNQLLDALDRVGLAAVANHETLEEEALTTLAKFFPKSAVDVEKHKFLLKYIWNKDAHDAPRYSGRGG
jgi:hypothetical protein